MVLLNSAFLTRLGFSVHSVSTDHAGDTLETETEALGVKQERGQDGMERTDGRGFASQISTSTWRVTVCRGLAVC